MFYIYLDTSFLSQLTKAAREIAGASFNSDKWINLLTLLRQGVNRGILLCPASQFQTQEAMLAEGLLQEFVSLQLELSGGYYFKKWEDILVHQVTNQVLIYLKRPQDIDLGWKILTKKCPPLIDKSTTEIMKSNMAVFAEIMKSQSIPEASYLKQYEAAKISFLHNSFLQPIRQILGLLTYSGSPNLILLGMLKDEAKIPNSEFMSALHFFDSPLVDRVPFINIFCSIFASLRFHEQKRNYSGSELWDVIALACAIPYCKIITTDTNMKNNIVGRLHLNKKYGVSVYAPTSKDLDILGRALSELRSR